MRTLFIVLALCWGSAHAQRPVKDVTPQEAISVAGRGSVQPVRFARIAQKVANNEPIGDREEGMFCQSRGRFIMNQNTQEAMRRGAGRAFRLELNRAGHPNPFTPASSSVFEEKAPVETDFEVGATVTQVITNLCISGKQVKGAVYIEARWELYSKSARKVVFDAVTEGSYQTTNWEIIGFSDWFERAFSIAVRNLLAHPEFSDRLTVAAAAPVAQAAPGAPIVLASVVAPAGGVAQNATLLRASVVTVNSGRGTGSGFFVSADGHLLTSAHVVGDVKFVKVQLATGREVIGEVLRVDAKRDVALLKTEPIGALPLPIRSTEPNVGEELYAIGSPLGQTFSGSLTRGILSGHRTLGDLRYLQSDVGVLPGNSGGPLLDASGKVVGIAKGGVTGGMGNLNLFVPIGDAASTLSLQVKDTP